MKIITVAGNVGKDAELKRTQNGDPVANFSVAVSDRKKETTWFDVTLWNKRAEALHSHIRKGDKITVMGDLQTREHNGKTYLQISATEITLQGGKPNGEQRQDNSGGDYGAQSGGGPTPMDDEIPFGPCVL